MMNGDSFENPIRSAPWTEARLVCSAPHWARRSPSPRVGAGKGGIDDAGEEALEGAPEEGGAKGEENIQSSKSQTECVKTCVR